MAKDVDVSIASYLEEREHFKGQTVPEGVEGLVSDGAIAMKHFLQYGRRAAVTKHNGFHEEDEWRIALSLRRDSLPPNIKFRPGTSMPIPYLELCMRCDPDPIGIEKIIVGPCPHLDQAIRAVDMLVKSEGFKGIPVVPSDIPYRNW